MLGSSIVASAAHHSVELLGDIGKTIKIRPLTIGDYKVLVKSMEGIDLYNLDEEKKIETYLQIDEAFDMVLKSCVIEPVDFDPMSLFADDWLYLFTELRSVSKGNILELNTTCNKCRNPIKFQIDLKDLKKHKRTDEKFEFKVNEKTTLYLMPPRRRDAYNIARYRKDEEKSQYDLIFLQLASYIDKIKHEETIHEDLLLEEKLEVFEALPYEAKEDFSKTIDEMNFGIQIYVDLKCTDQECGSEFKDKAVDILDFFIE